MCRDRPGHPLRIHQLLVLVHNGFRFDFALLLFECQRHSLSWSPLERWLFVDTLEVLRGFGVEDLGGCLQLQCLARVAGGAEGLRAHRALDDCVALRGVMECMPRGALRSGPPGAFAAVRGAA